MTKRRGMPPTAEPGMAGDFADEVRAFNELKRIRDRLHETRRYGTHRC
jgi:hypothetical protein